VSPLAWTHLRTRRAMASLFGWINCGSFVGRGFCENFRRHFILQQSPQDKVHPSTVQRLGCSKSSVENVLYNQQRNLVYSNTRMNTHHPILLRITEYQFITIHLTNSGQVARYTFFIYSPCFVFVSKLLCDLYFLILGLVSVNDAVAVAKIRQLFEILYDAFFVTDAWDYKYRSWSDQLFRINQSGYR